jgi:3-(3-hydroxy-phenyl)propionate hydroxylase
LTTPNPRYPATGRPPRGQVPLPAPGVLMPDVETRDGTRVRTLARRPTCNPLVIDRAAVPDIPPGEAWVLRPDAHIAAILDAADKAGIEAATRRTTGRA